MTTYKSLPNSTYLDLTSYAGNASLPAGTPFVGKMSFNVALVLERAHSPKDLLNAGWATRQEEIARLNEQDKLWKKYGADPDAFDQVLDKLDDLGIPTFYDKNAPANGQYVSSVESRTIWVTVDQSSFTTLFGPKAVLRDGGENALGERVVFWEGNLSLPKAMVDAGVVGLWFDGAFSAPILADPGSGPEAKLHAGPQSPGNSAPGGEFPNEIAARYNFPFADEDLSTSVKTAAIGLVEPGIGTALPSTETKSFDELLREYRESAGIDAPLKPVISVSAGGQEAPTRDERTMDTSIVTTVDPLSRIILYAGSGSANSAHGNTFTAYQSAIWDTVNNPRVISSSFSSPENVSPGSPFYKAQKELFIDAVLRNITMVNAAGDGGSGGEYPNGLTNVVIMHASRFSLVASGASLSTVAAAGSDKTLSDIVADALAHDPATIWQLVSGGLKVLPTNAGSAATLIETVWNGYHVFKGAGPNGEDVIADKSGKGGGYLNNSSGAGGIDTTQRTPSYQKDFGLDLVTSDPRALPGRALPDVAATSGSNMGYLVPNANFEEKDGSKIHANGGTSAAAPLWAALMTQVNAVFKDQGLPRLGYMNDLLYTAAVIAPAAFNDVTVGNNTSSAVLGGDYLTPGKHGDEPTVAITPTGYGYSAGPGFDLTTGLGTPNGVLLTRAMTWIAHSEMSFADGPDVLDDHKGGWRNPVKQDLIVQTTSEESVKVRIGVEGDRLKFKSAGSDQFAWTSQFAQQALQRDFDPALVKLFDGQSQGALVHDVVKPGKDFAVSIDGAPGIASQGTLSTGYGFVDFFSGSGDAAVRIARPVAVAETVGGEDDQVAIVRIRQGGKADVAVKFYRVDDFAGTIDGLKPGSKGYAAAAGERAYETASGKMKVKGPGYGEYKQARLVDVDAGDIIAMKLNRGDHTYWAFAQANEKAHGKHVAHLWDYGVNTWGWEAQHKGGDRDFNDLVVQIDFTSAYGSEWLV